MLGERQVAAPLMARRAAHGALRPAHRRFQPGEGIGIQLAGLGLSGKPQRPSHGQFGHETLVLAFALFAPAASRPGQHRAVLRQCGRQVAPCGHTSTVGDGGAGTPRRYFAWGQAVRGAVLAVLLVHAAAGLDGLVSVFLPASQYRIVPVPPATMAASPGGAWPATVWYLAGYVWIVAFVALVLGHYRAARVIAALAILPALVWLLQGQLTGSLLSPFGSWAFWFLLDLAPVLAMAAFHRDAPAAARRPWLLALPAYYLLVSVPVLAAELTGHFAWLPDTPGLCCLLVAVLCLAHVPRAWSSRAGTGVWSLTLVLLAAVAGTYRIVSLGDYLQDPRWPSAPPARPGASS